MAAIEDGMYQPAMKARMDDLERQKVEIMARMAEAPADVPDIHPNIAEIYKAKVVHLTEALADPELHSEAARSEEHTSELQSLMRISYAVFCLKKNNNRTYKS